MNKEKLIVQCPYCGSIEQEDGTWDGIKKKLEDMSLILTVLVLLVLKQR